jgi:hypothetical protein
MNAKENFWLNSSQMEGNEMGETCGIHGNVKFFPNVDPISCKRKSAGKCGRMCENTIKIDIKLLRILIRSSHSRFGLTAGL